MHYYTANPELDAARFKDDEEAKAAQAEAAQTERRDKLAYAFLDALAYEDQLPVQAAGAELETLIAEHAALVVPLIKWAALYRKEQPRLRFLLDPLAEAWAREVESCT